MECKNKVRIQRKRGQFQQSRPKDLVWIPLWSKSEYGSRDKPFESVFFQEEVGIRGLPLPVVELRVRPLGVLVDFVDP